MIIQTCEQYTSEWWSTRRGLPTASCADKILTPTGKLSTQSRQYMNELIADKLGYGDPPMEPTAWMQRGIDLEPDARNLYELLTGQSVKQVGFITNDDITAGCSPDGLIGDVNSMDILIARGWEVKCPKASTHIGYLLGGKLPDFYRPQVHFSMAVTGLRHWVFMSYFPEMEPLIVPVVWDDYTDTIDNAIDEFVAQLQAAYSRLKLAA